MRLFEYIISQFTFLQSIIVIAVVALVIFKLKATSDENKILADNIYKDFLLECESISNQGEVVYFSADDIESIAKQIKDNDSKSRKLSSQKILLILLFVLIGGIIGLVFALIIFKINYASANISIRNQKLNVITCRFRYLSESGIASYWTVDDIRQVLINDIIDEEII